MLSRLVSRVAPRTRVMSSSASAPGFGFQLSDDSRAYVELARKFAKVRAWAQRHGVTPRHFWQAVQTATGIRSREVCCVCGAVLQEEIIPVAAEYDRTMKYPTPVFNRAFEVSRCSAVCRQAAPPTLPTNVAVVLPRCG